METKNIQKCSTSLFFLLAALQILRGLRDVFALEIGLERLEFLISGSFVTVTILSLISTRLRISDRQWLSALSGFLILGLLVSIQQSLYEFAYILIGGFSLILISQLWKTISGTTKSKSKRSYMSVAIWGSLGAITGPFLLIMLLPILGHKGLIVMALLFLVLSLLVILNTRPITRFADVFPKSEKPKTNGLWLSTFVFGYALLSTFIYVKQLEIIDSYTASPVVRTYLFALRDLIIGFVLIILQIYISRYKVNFDTKPMTFMPILTFFGIIVISLIPTISVLIVSIVLLKSYNYALVRPSRELYSAVSPSILNYKNGIDSIIYRSGDLVAIWLITTFNLTNKSIIWLALGILPIVLLWYLSGKKIEVHLNRIS